MAMHLFPCALQTCHSVQVQLLIPHSLQKIVLQTAHKYPLHLSGIFVVWRRAVPSDVHSKLPGGHACPASPSDPGCTSRHPGPTPMADRCPHGHWQASSALDLLLVCFLARAPGLGRQVPTQHTQQPLLVTFLKAMCHPFIIAA